MLVPNLRQKSFSNPTGFGAVRPDSNNKQKRSVEFNLEHFNLAYFKKSLNLLASFHPSRLLLHEDC